MPESEWEEGFKIVEVIEVTGSAETVLCVIGAWPPGNKVVMYTYERNDELVHEEAFGFGPRLPMAELVSDLEEHLRTDARAMGARFEVFEIPEPFGQDQFEAVVAARWAAACRTWGNQSEPTASGPPNLR
ncbi:MAG: hypothetical protein ABSA52_00200 [Candidatus Binatia bacterium]|jgi:hypothetical protein